MAEVQVLQNPSRGDTPSPMACAAAAGPAPDMGSPSSPPERSHKRARTPQRGASNGVEDQVRLLKESFEKEKTKTGKLKEDLKAAENKIK